MRATKWAAVLMTLLAPALAGCAGGPPADRTLTAEELLGTAGFTLKTVTTQAQGERLSKLPQRKVLRFTLPKEEAYLWADVFECRCFYVGTRQNYETLLALQKEGRGQQRLDWYDAQDNDPLWGNPQDW